jgi:hypothetical protein
MRWDRAELVNYNNPVPFPQIVAADFAVKLLFIILLLIFFLGHLLKT